MPRPTSCDVLIVGAGAAGLAAAAELARAGRSVLLLEARDRIGGRVWSRMRLESGAAGHGTAPIELGAEFIHGELPATQTLLAATGAAALEVRREHWLSAGGRVAPLGDVFLPIERTLTDPALRRRDLSFADFLAGSRGRRLPPRARSFARLLVEGFNGADPERASARDIADEYTGGGSPDAPTFRPEGGYGALLGALAGAARLAGARLRLQSVVTAIRWRRGRVECEGTRIGRPFSVVAPHAIVTLPLGVLQAPPEASGAVRFDPPLRAKRRALAGLRPSLVAKVVLRFEQAFWEELDGGRLKRAVFIHAPRATFPTLWTALPERAPRLTVRAGGPRAARLAGLAPQDVVREALRCVAASLAGGARGSGAAGRGSGRRAARVEELIEQQLEEAHVHDWTNDPFARGAYSYVAVGGMSARRALAAPLLGTLHFAGEATDDEHSATVEGALRSGQRAAREVLRAGRR